MKRTIISHNVETTEARVKFEHNGVTLEDNFLLNMVIPGTKQIFEQLEMPFDKAKQLKALDKLTETVTANIENGAIVNKPEPVADPVVPAEPEHPAAPVVPTPEDR